MKELCELYAAEIVRYAHNKFDLRVWPQRLQNNEDFDAFFHEVSLHRRSCHILWMLEEIPKFMDWQNNPKNENGEFVLNPDKAHRWLGFVQGWMWSNNICSINWLRESVNNHVSK
jgi:hypothetical protein